MPFLTIPPLITPQLFGPITVFVIVVCALVALVVLLVRLTLNDPRQPPHDEEQQ